MEKRKRCYDYYVICWKELKPRRINDLNRKKTVPVDDYEEDYEDAY